MKNKALGTLTLIVSLVSCVYFVYIIAREGGFMPGQFSTFAAEVDILHDFIFWWSVVFFVGVVGAMHYFVMKYIRKDENEMPGQVGEPVVLEAAWIVGPTLLVMVIFWWGFQSYMKITVPPSDAYEIQVKAQKWAWQFSYPEGVISTEELVVPEGRPVRLIMTSQDVLHSFFAPALRVKHDLVPNRYTSVWFEATETGDFEIYCTEYCGDKHSQMPVRLLVRSEDDFQAWITDNSVNPDELEGAELGEYLYTAEGCQSCHSVDGSRVVGPSFQGTWGTQRQLASGGAVTVDENYVRESILNPAAKVAESYPPSMPPLYGGWDDRKIEAMTAYIKSLSDN